MMHGGRPHFFLEPRVHQSLDFAKDDACVAVAPPPPVRCCNEPMSQDRQQMSAKPFYPPAVRPPLSVRSIATTDRRAQGRYGEVCCATPPARVQYRRDAIVRW